MYCVCYCFQLLNFACRQITGSIEGMAEGSGLSAQFLSLVLLPLAGNAVEHITAVMVAMKNKMDLALAIAIGSSIQIAIFVLPTCVLFAWSIGNPFSLQLDPLGVHLCSQFLLVTIVDEHAVLTPAVRLRCSHSNPWHAPCNFIHDKSGHNHVQIETVWVRNVHACMHVLRK
jgi:Ca2+/Na+ antiporter